jgi:predicted nucleotidyltransferase
VVVNCYTELEIKPATNPPMDRTTDTVTALLKATPGVSVATVFGSFARGRSDAESDIDVAVAGGRPLSAADKSRLIEQIALVTGRPVDLIDLSTANGPVLQQALARGRLVKCDDRALYARLILRMLYNQADDMPYRRRILEQRQRAWTRA